MRTEAVSKTESLTDLEWPQGAAEADAPAQVDPGEVCSGESHQ